MNIFLGLFRPYSYGLPMKVLHDEVIGQWRKCISILWDIHDCEIESHQNKETQHKQQWLNYI